MRLMMISASSAAAFALTLGAALPAAAQETQTPPESATMPPSSAAAPSAPTGSAAPTTTTAPEPAKLTVGLPVKDKTGVVVGEITDLKPAPTGGEQATVKMGDQSFSIGAQSFVVQNGAAVINATAAQLKQMIASAAKGG